VGAAGAIARVRSHPRRRMGRWLFSERDPWADRAFHPAPAPRSTHAASSSPRRRNRPASTTCRREARPTATRCTTSTAHKALARSSSGVRPAAVRVASPGHGRGQVTATPPQFPLVRRPRLYPVISTSLRSECAALHNQRDVGCVLRSPSGDGARPCVAR
jgi:hypothetical protein